MLQLPCYRLLQLALEGLNDLPAYQPTYSSYSSFSSLALSLPVIYLSLSYCSLDLILFLLDPCSFSCLFSYLVSANLTIADRSFSASPRSAGAPQLVVSASLSSPFFHSLSLLACSQLFALQIQPEWAFSNSPLFFLTMFLAFCLAFFHLCLQQLIAFWEWLLWVTWLVPVFFCSLHLIFHFWVLSTELCLSWSQLLSLCCCLSLLFSPSLIFTHPFWPFAVTLQFLTLPFLTIFVPCLSTTYVSRFVLPNPSRVSQCALRSDQYSYPTPQTQRVVVFLQKGQHLSPVSSKPASAHTQNYPLQNPTAVYQLFVVGNQSDC